MVWQQDQVLQPTDPFMYCDWGDDTPPSPNNESFPMVPENTTYPIYHEFRVANVYEIYCTMSNMVTNITFNRTVSLTPMYYFTLLFIHPLWAGLNRVKRDLNQDCQTLKIVKVVIMEKIMNFTAEPLYVPIGGDQDVDEPSEGLGEQKIQFPVDRNITFFFDYMQGTISAKVIKHTAGLFKSLTICFLFLFSSSRNN